MNFKRGARTAALAGAMVATLAATGCGLIKPNASHASPPSSAQQLPAMSPAQLAGQRVIYSYSGLTPPDSLLRLIRHGEAAGVIFFAGNISSPGQLAAVCRELQAANRYRLNPMHNYPLILTTDQEGGPAVSRLPGAPTMSEKQIGASANPSANAAAAGIGAAHNLQRAGLNTDLAPVLDVFRTPGNFIDAYGRSYSSNPSVVAQLGAAFIGGLQHGRVAATAKHFPGLGAATAQQNTDLAPVTLHTSLGQLRAIDELPYRSAIRAGARLVMLSWASYPAFGESLPAGLSAKVVGELRHHLGFTGVTVTDALEAVALQSYGSFGNRAVLAAKAGMDLMLASGSSLDEGNAVRNTLGASYVHSALGRDAFRAAVARILALRASLA